MKNSTASEKVGNNQNEVEAELSGGEEEGGGMLKVLEGITDGERMEVGCEGALALVRAQARDATKVHAPIQTAGRKRIFTETVSTSDVRQEGTRTGSALGLEPGPIGALTQTVGITRARCI